MACLQPDEAQAHTLHEGGIQIMALKLAKSTISLILKNTGIRKYIRRMFGYTSCTRRLNHQLHAQCFTDAGNGVETWLRIGPQRLI